MLREKYANNFGVFFRFSGASTVGNNATRLQNRRSVGQNGLLQIPEITNIIRISAPLCVGFLCKYSQSGTRGVDQDFICRWQLHRGGIGDDKMRYGDAETVGGILHKTESCFIPIHGDNLTNIVHQLADERGFTSRSRAEINDALAGPLRDGSIHELRIKTKGTA